MPRRTCLQRLELGQRRAGLQQRRVCLRLRRGAETDRRCCAALSGRCGGQVAGHDQCIDLYGVAAGYARYARCSGHSATVFHLDWAADCRLLQSVDSSYELLYWDASTGRQACPAPGRGFGPAGAYSL